MGDSRPMKIHVSGGVGYRGTQYCVSAPEGGRSVNLSDNVYSRLSIGAKKLPEVTECLQQFQSEVCVGSAFR